MLVRERDRARADYAKTPGADPSSGVFKRAMKAVEDVKECEGKIEELQKAQIGTLKMVGREPSSGSSRDGDNYGANAWERLAREIDLGSGVTQVTVDAIDLLKAPMAAGFTPSPGSGWTAPSYLEDEVVAKGRDERHVFEVLPQIRVEEGDLALTEYKQTGSRTVTGEVIRDPLATTDKAALELSLALETLALKQFAVTISDVPSQLFTSIEALQGFLQDELAFQIRGALDAHVLAQVTAATPPHSKTGADLIAQVRNALAAARALGARPTVLALTPTEKAALDLTKTELGTRS